MKHYVSLLSLTLLIFALLVAFSSCFKCEHEWLDATCTTPSVCSLCGEETGESLGHNFVIDDEIAATCTEEGCDSGSRCSVCGHVLIPQVIIPARGHIKSDWKLIEESTLINAGIEEIFCLECDATLDSREIEKKYPKVTGTSFNFTDDEFIEWIESMTALKFILIDTSSQNTTYAIKNTSTDETGVLLLNHKKYHTEEDEIRLIGMYMFDENLQSLALITHIGELINSTFSSDDAFEALYYDKTYTKANMTSTMLELDEDMNYAVLAPTEYFDYMLSQ